MVLVVLGCFWAFFCWVSLFLRDLLVYSWKLVFVLRFSRFLGGLAAVLGSSWVGPGLGRKSSELRWNLVGGYVPTETGPVSGRQRGLGAGILQNPGSYSLELILPHQRCERPGQFRARVGENS